MHQTYTLLGFFTVILAIIFQITKSFVSAASAFLLATVVTLVIVFGTVGITEGLAHDTKFEDLKILGSVRIRPKDNFDDSTLFQFTTNANEVYTINGRAHGTIN